ncbi:hypothetical protein SAMN04487915_10634 [Arthrobacter sp. ov118]|jgi:hypothetical protein|nr:hypothetical protein SAMN04487915_10634 [Arthrobacter sp. ov118]
MGSMSSVHRVGLDRGRRQCGYVGIGLCWQLGCLGIHRAARLRSFPVAGRGDGSAAGKTLNPGQGLGRAWEQRGRSVGRPAYGHSEMYVTSRKPAGNGDLIPGTVP